MGTWGTGLYSGDFATDLRATGAEYLGIDPALVAILIVAALPREATQDAQKGRADTRETPGVGGNTGPTPPANQTEDERRSG